MVTFGALSTIVSSSPNFVTFAARTITVATAGTPVQLPTLAIPDGTVLALRAKPSNGPRRIFLADSQANTGSPQNRITLAQGEAINQHLQNADAVWIDASGNGAEIELLVEQ